MPSPLESFTTSSQIWTMHDLHVSNLIMWFVRIWLSKLWTLYLYTYMIKVSTNLIKETSYAREDEKKNVLRKVLWKHFLKYVSDFCKGDNFKMWFSVKTKFIMQRYNMLKHYFNKCPNGRNIHWPGPLSLLEQRNNGTFILIWT